MDRQQMLEALDALGFDTSKITDAVTDDMLAEILSLLQVGSEAQSAQDQPEGQMAEASRDDMVAAIVEAGGHTKEELDALSDDEIKALFESLQKPEGQMAERGEMIALLLEKGHSQEELDAMNDEQLAMLFESEFGGEKPEGQMAEDSASISREDMIAALVAAGHPQDQLDALSDEELRALFEAEVVNAAAASGASAPATGAAPSTPAVNAMSEKLFKFSEVATMVRQVVNEELGKLKQVLANTQNQANQLMQNAKRANIVAFCESLRNEGKLLPVEFESTVHRLMRADTHPVFKFSEGGKPVKKSELDLQAAELQARPVLVGLVERLAQPLTQRGTEENKIKSHFARFSEQFRKAGTTNAGKLIKAFRLMRRKNPGLTAEVFLGQESA